MCDEDTAHLWLHCHYDEDWRYYVKKSLYFLLKVMVMIKFASYLTVIVVFQKRFDDMYEWKESGLVDVKGHSHVRL